jgi:sugar phosphate isomerase/epimerase
LNGHEEAATIQAFAAEAARADIVISEVGAWSNPLSPDPETREKALEKCRNGLELAERIGARCCVNIAGSRGEKWDGPHAEDLTTETFDLIVDTVRSIIDAVKPRKAVYALETMPWMYPDSPEAYVRLIEAIDRPQFGVHLDPVNMINSPERYFHNARFIRHCFALLGPRIVGCHAKDIILRPNLTVHLDEVAPGKGTLDYRVFLQEVKRVGSGIPVMLEHLQTAEEYEAAARYVRDVEAGLCSH